MYNEKKGLFYHAADSANSNSGTYWLRSMGWYAAAMADVMDSMSLMKTMKNVKSLQILYRTKSSCNMSMQCGFYRCLKKTNKI
jgi:rhamnogalacturonyl hydrolase YesR